ncbi:glycosyltransferase [Rhodoferax sp.]|uniref:glycosyltransferase n=1 Tax=Rhodoferax sp. TaxID=50421 RepID=UPI0027358473|nr:glycosyltransferase [Rhodoferax sp.]MDP3192348.1 glycosyltransferase [Rhodoferax sp.]
MATPDNLPQNLEVKRVKPSIWQRLRAEWWLAQNARLQDTILCFGNLPPLFGLRGHVLVFLQNRYLVDDVKLDGFPLKTRLRLWIERLWLSGRMENASEFIVQTPSMKRLLEARTNGKISVCVLPFMANYVEHVRKMPPLGIQKEKKSILLYVASGEPHKNHRQLIEAWCLLAKDGLFPRLTLTLDRANFAGLCDWMGKKIEQYSLDVENVGNVPHAHVMQLYDRAAALIYPSTFESFGLPLIEAMQAGLPVLASELDYVRDVLDPDQTFNPESAVSIARAVKRFLGVEEQPLPLQDAAGFMRQILGKVK